MFHKIIIFVFVLLCLISSAAATDYYVSTSGNNASDGLTVETAWRNVSYGVSQLTTPGDTLYLIDGTWEDEHIVPANDGTESNPITIIAYNGTPTLNGITQAGAGITFDGNSYWTVDGITITNYYNGIYLTASNNITILNNTISDLSYTAVSFRGGTVDSRMSYNSISNTFWNQIQIAGTTSVTNNITISYNDITNSTNHGLIDFMGNFTNINIIGNTIHDSIYSAMYVHQTVVDGYLNSGYLNIRDNFMYNVSYGIYMDDPTNNSIIDNNTIYDMYLPDTLFGHHIKVSDPTINITVSNNTMWGDSYGYMIQDNTLNSLYSDNNITGLGADIEYRFLNTPNTIRDPSFGSTVSSWSVYSTTPYTIEYTAGTIFTNALYYPSGSTLTLSAGVTITPKHITILPISGYGQNVTVNVEQVNDISNITVNVSEPTTVTLTFRVDNTSNTYNLSVNNVYNQQAVSNSDSIVSFDYIFSSSIPTNFEVTWASNEGWDISSNVLYKGRVCRFSDDGSYLCTGATQEDEIITSFLVVAS